MKKVLLTVRITRFYWSSWWSVCYFQCCGLSIIVCSIVLFLLSLLESVSDDLFGILCPLFCLSLLESQLLMTSLVSSDDLFGIFWWPLWYLLMTSLVSSNDLFGNFWWPLWYLRMTSLVSSNDLFGIFWWPLWYLQTFLTNNR